MAELSLEETSDFRRRLSQDLVTSILVRLGSHARRNAGSSCAYFSFLVRLGRSMSLFRVIASRSAAGVKHTLVCTSDGDLYTFGSGANGMLGHGGEDNEATPRVVEALSHVHVSGVACGNMHSVVMTKQGGCYTFGHAWYGRLGHPDQEQDQVRPQLVETLRDKRLVAVAAGDDHTLVSTDDGGVYSFGYGALGKLGHGGGDSESIPRRVEGLAGIHVVKIAAGFYHSVVCSDTGAAYSFGDGRHGKLGHGDLKNRRQPRRVEALCEKAVRHVGTLL